MRLSHMVMNELRLRKLRLATALLAVATGVAIMVSVRTVVVSYRGAVDRQLAHLGANIVVVPEGLRPAALHTLRFGDSVMPEDYAARLTGDAGIVPPGSVGASLAQPVTVGESRAVLEGVSSELRLEGSPDTTGLGLDEVLVGSDLARSEHLIVGGHVTLFGQSLRVAEVLDETGTLADGTVFSRLQTAQRLSALPGGINIIKISASRRDLADRIHETLPGVRVLTRGKVVRMRIAAVSMVERYSLVFSFVIVLLGALSIANYMTANVRERRREIGTLLAVGATPAQVSGLFLGKALIVGFLGGVLGYALGSSLAMVHGSAIVRAAVLPLPWLLGPAALIATAITMAATALPAWRAARLDPVDALREG